MAANAKVQDRLIRAIREARSIRPSPFSGAPFEGITSLEIDARGSVGERFVARLLMDRGDSVVQNDQTNPLDKQWDIKVSRSGAAITAEVKTATMGKSTRTFQHENLPHSRACDILVLIDIAPDAVYGTVALPSELPYAAKNSRWTATPKMMHKRPSGDYKWTLHINDVKGREITTPDKFYQMWDGAAHRLGGDSP